MTRRKEGFLPQNRLLPGSSKIPKIFRSVFRWPIKQIHDKTDNERLFHKFPMLVRASVFSVDCASIAPAITAVAPKRAASNRNLLFTTLILNFGKLKNRKCLYKTTFFNCVVYISFHFKSIFTIFQIPELLQQIDKRFKLRTFFMNHQICLFIIHFAFTEFADNI